MNLASALIKQILILQDFETWSAVRQQYLPIEYHTLFTIIEKHCEKFQELPTFEDLKFEIRDLNTQEKLCAVESTEDVEADPFMLLQYLKNEYAQKEILNELENYIDNSVAFDDAEESVGHLHQIVLDVEERVELEKPQESMQRIELFETQEELGKYLALGINHDFDLIHQFSPRDLILIGGYRGSGKSLTCGNVAVNMFDAGRSSVTYSIEMDKRSCLQRMCAMATGICATRLKQRNLNNLEWVKVASWWASRFLNSAEILENYKEHRDFDDFHRKLTSGCELLPTQRLDVVYDPALTISKIRADLDKKVKGNMDIGVIIVDYINKIKLSAMPSRRGSFDWTEQIEISTALKHMAQDYEIPILSPYQIDASGEARFAKGILDAADAAYTLKPYKGDTPCIVFECQKLRDGNDEIGFISTMDWSSLKMGPETAPDPTAEEDDSPKTGEAINDLEE